MFTFDPLNEFVLFWGISHSLYIFYGFTEEPGFSMAYLFATNFIHENCLHNVAKMDFHMIGIVLKLIETRAG